MRWSRLWRRLALVLCVFAAASITLIVALLDAMRSWNDTVFVALAVLGPTGLAALLAAGVWWALAGLKSRRRLRPQAQWLSAAPGVGEPEGKPVPNRRPWIAVVPRAPFRATVAAGSGV